MDFSFFLLMAAMLVPAFLAIVVSTALLIKSSRGRDIRKKDNLAVRIGKEAFDFALPMGNPQADMATVFAFGKKQPQRIDDTMIFRATTGWRYGFIAVTAFLMYLSTQLEAGPLIYYIVGGGGLLWCGIYMWVFRLEISGTQMVCTKGNLTAGHYDLALLHSVRDTKDGYKLRFSDGQRLTVPQFLEGHGVLRKLMIEALDANGR